MNILEAVEAAKIGHAIRRESWKDGNLNVRWQKEYEDSLIGEFDYFDRTELSWRPFRFTAKMLLADDWKTVTYREEIE